MNYLRSKYDGYKTIPTEFLKDELLLNRDEFQDVRSEIRTILGRCPKEISFDLFDSIVDLHL